MVGCGHRRSRAASRCAAALTALFASVAVGACGGAPRTPASEPSEPSQEAEAIRPVRVSTRTTTVRLVDRRRTVQRRTGLVEPRRLTTIVRYPEVTGGTAADRARQFPLVVFAHGYALSPSSYRYLLRTWAKAGYVVAAPVLPGENANAPGGPDRRDLINQPADLRFVIDRLIGRSSRPSGRLSGVIDSGRIAVAGHSDGGNTALAVAYDPRFRSRRVDAAVILAGADLPGVTPFSFRPDGPPLLAVQGTADSINAPADTARYYDRASVPKAMLTFIGGGHFEPYMKQRPQVRILARVTRGFLDRELKDRNVTSRELAALGRRQGVSTFSQSP